MTSALSDPNSVQFTVVEGYEAPGFTEDEIQWILGRQSHNAVVAGATSVAFEANEDKYDGGGMVALVPSDADLNRLTLDGEEPRDDLHLTLFYLGDEELTPEQQEDVLREVAHAAEDWGPIEARAFGVAHWNPESEHPAWVLNVGDASEQSMLASLRAEVGSGIAQDFILPPQHTPWQPHICIAYSSDDLLDELTERLGPITFDKIRVAYGRDVIDIELDSDDDDDNDGVEDDSTVTAAGKNSGNRNNIKDYWTKDPRGLAKWVDKPHPWTSLYNHLRKHMPDEMAKRVASEWYHEVKGHWPNEGKKHDADTVVADAFHLPGQHNQETHGHHGVGASESVRNLLSAYSSGYTVDRELGGGKSGAQVEVLTLDDGSRVVRKIGGARREQGDSTTRREYLGGLLFNALGGDDIHTAQTDDNTVITTYVDGKSGAELLQDSYNPDDDWATKRQKTATEYERQARLPGGKEIALLDYLGKNVDRHNLNWQVVRGNDGGERVVPIDQGELDFTREFVDLNGQQVEEGTTSVFSNYWLGVKGGLMSKMKPKITRDEVATYRRNLERLRGEFNQGDEPTWFDALMGRLDFLESKVSS